MALTACTDQVRAGWFDLDPPGPAMAMAEGRSHSGPRAYHAMCAREPTLCAADLRASTATPGAPAAMTEPRWRQVLDLNQRLNDAIRPRDDIDIYGVSDYWTEGRGSGDCEDYSIAKKQALMRAGWRADQLLYAIAVVEGYRLPYHVVLVLRTTQGDYVLDNLTDRIEPWEDTGYDFVMRQSAAAPANWARVSNRAAVGLAAAQPAATAATAAIAAPRVKRPAAPRPGVRPVNPIPTGSTECLVIAAFQTWRRGMSKDRL